MTVHDDVTKPYAIEPADEPIFRIVLIDLTTSATPDALRPASAFQSMMDAWTEQIDGPFSAAYGLTPVAFRIGTPADREPSEIGMNWRDAIPEAPGALAFHQVVGGIPDIELGASLFQTLTDGSGGQESASGGGSHELLELLGDVGANMWADKQDGSNKTCAREMCDVVQNTGYSATNGVWVSNFLLPAYWIPGAPGPFDHLAVMSDRNDVSHGYEIQADAAQNVAQVGGVMGARTARIHVAGVLTDLQKQRKRHPYSRSYRRGLRI